MEAAPCLQPHGLMLKFCLKFLQEVFDSNRSILMDYLTSGLTSPELDSLREGFPLFSYAIRYVFEHARSYELVNHQSSYHELQEYEIKGGEIFKLHYLASSAMSYNNGNRGYDCCTCNRGHAFGIF